MLSIQRNELTSVRDGHRRVHRVRPSEAVIRGKRCRLCRECFIKRNPAYEGHRGEFFGILTREGRIVSHTANRPRDFN